MDGPKERTVAGARIGKAGKGRAGGKRRGRKPAGQEGGPEGRKPEQQPDGDRDWGRQDGPRTIMRAGSTTRAKEGTGDHEQQRQGNARPAEQSSEDR